MFIKGFRFSAVEAAIKRPGRKDIALIYSEVPATAAAVFTTNKVKAAPVLLSAKNIASGQCQALLVNSGNANACTGERGMSDAIETASMLASKLQISEKLIQVCSTGVIGVPLPMERIRTALPSLVSELGNVSLEDIAEAIMTTDTFAKSSVLTGAIEGKSYTIAGIAKGAGMIMPNMATMLSFIITDAAVDPALINQIFLSSVERSFNAITIDGDTSTNDTCLLMANGASGAPLIKPATPEAAQFTSLLDSVLLDLAKQIVKDGEGATKFVEIRIKGASNDSEAKKAAISVANSSLVKTAFYGQDANWGRIFAAIGYSGIEVNPDLLALWFDDVCMAKQGIFAGGNAEERGTEILHKKDFTVTVDLGIGDGTATVYTSDLSHEYVSINADYRT